ncbi:Minor histocompatibility antigen H13 [Lasiodiplodia hormozganensis]|uniref:Minor histocompatibility antigen H13 n=1 Tax=Lasiodiplodia hormozganensis TaxID=869390 RepID=A0AA39Z166_9PEZI|nr:Minor histocompatibility antigen H13 [Lasiodiplodia hormozganensis]
MSDPGPIYELLGKLAYAFAEAQPLLPTYSHLLISALFPIYAGAHSSLTRPSSAAKPKKAPKVDTADDGYESEEDEEEEIQQMEGLSTRDAIIFPIMAGVTLTGLYFLIKWMQDPQLLNKILNAYFSLFGVLSKWTVKFFLRNVASVRGHLGLHGVVGFVLAVVAVGYFNFVDKPWFLTNLMGFAFSYGALQLMSPTTFSTGTLLLSALFFYDIYMVFFTPMMVTVAKSLDIPIKLVFPRPDIPSADPAKPPIKQHAMLGLGDVVLPGIMIGLALRFDLYLHYLRKQTTLKASSQATEANKDSGATSDASSTDQSVQIVKAPYASVSNKWGEWFWARSAAHSFPKPYFTATMVGYVVGMLTTLAAMQIADHAQPALLYLVPGVLIACWGTALVRGELKVMQDFSEAFEDEEELRNHSILSKERTKRAEKKLERATKKYVETVSESGDEVVQSRKGKNADSSHDHDHDVFYFAISAPFSFSKKEKSAEEEKGASSETDSANSTVNWRSASGTQAAGGEPAEKRRRTS